MGATRASSSSLEQKTKARRHESLYSVVTTKQIHQRLVIHQLLSEVDEYSFYREISKICQILHYS